MYYHIDMANHYHQGDFSFIVIVNVNYPDTCSAVILKDPFRRKLIQRCSLVQVHASIISLLIRDYLPLSKVIICHDVRPVEKIIGLVWNLFPELTLDNLKPLSDLRKEIGKYNYKSEADAYAKKVFRNYKKSRNIHRNRLKGNILIIPENQKAKEELEKILGVISQNNR